MKPLRSIFLLLPLLFLCCTHPTEVINQTGNSLDASANGKTVIYPGNQFFTLNLDVHADAGYQWDYSFSNPAVVGLTGSPTIRQKDPGPVMVGGAAIETFLFLTTEAGECTVTLIEHQSWMKDVPPINTVSFTVVVR